MRLGEYPPKEDNMPNLAEKLLEEVESFLEDYIGTSIIGVIKAGHSQRAIQNILLKCM